VYGTETVLESCKKAGTVKRVVVTSSMAAITDSPENKHVYTEADWNTKSSLARNPYYFSKVMAEKAAWKFSRAEKLDVVVINVCMCLWDACACVKSVCWMSGFVR